MEPAQYSLTIVILAGVALFIVGAGLGVVFGRRTSPAAQRQREAELRLDQVLQDKKAYEDEVVEHFTETATLLNNLTERYRDVHNHLAQGASALCQGRGPVSLEQLDGRRDESEIPPYLADVRPPLDYAPKASPGEKGMLNEEFGIDRRASAAQGEKAGARAAADIE
ncbi:MAG: YhcB family protein [Gammaproteobacteria bacterium]|nr:YhcB family protein [Gammaproteobacteria bacterium]MDH5171202.1 YhcB family protein [Gammaproteobacteria bacterium]